MPKQKYLWWMERKIGSVSSWVTKGRKGPQLREEGTLRFGKGDYAVDPHKFRVWKVPKGIHPGDIVKVQIWAEDDLIPKDFLNVGKEIGDGFTATLLQRISKVKRLDLARANKENDKIVIILAIAVIVAMVAISVLAYLVVKK